MHIQWSPESVQDLKSLVAYIHDHHGDSARVVGTIMETVALLANTPYIGRSGRVAGTRELIIADTPYIVPYRVKNNVLQILRVYHSSRQWPESF